MTEASALQGIRVCDLGGLLAGAGATRWLAAFGAEVIRVEDPVREGRWDMLRAAGPYIDDRRGINVGGAFNNHNVGKLGTTINLRMHEGKELLRRLIEVSDVVTENFASGVMERLGFAYTELRKIRPDIIYVSNSGFGHSGPYRDFKSLGPVVQALSGLTFMSGLAGRSPAGWGYSYMDHQGGYFMAIAVLGALVARHRTGEGQWVDMACTETAGTLLGPALLDFTVNGRPSRREGYPNSNKSEDRSMAPHGVYPTSEGDRWIALACRSDEDWRRLRGVINEPWVSQACFDTLDGRLMHEKQLDRSLSEWTRRNSRTGVVEMLTGAGVPAALVALPEERIDNDATNANWGLWPTVTHTEMGRVRVDGLPVKLSRTDGRMENGAPCLGEHDDYVLREILGKTQSEIERLRRDGVVKAR